MASSADSSTIKPQSLACLTISLVIWRTCSRVFFSFASMCKSDTGIMRWMLSAPAFATASMSPRVPLEALQISAFKPASAMSLTALLRLRRRLRSLPRSRPRRGRLAAGLFAVCFQGLKRLRGFVLRHVGWCQKHVSAQGSGLIKQFPIFHHTQTKAKAGADI